MEGKGGKNPNQAGKKAHEPSYLKDEICKNLALQGFNILLVTNQEERIVRTELEALKQFVVENTRPLTIFKEYDMKQAVDQVDQFPKYRWEGDQEEVRNHNGPPQFQVSYLIFDYQVNRKI
mmetsp:Transcript_11702/g.19756  ORF Transcript_11702/g.19756 Transcript_11702/m.19756 type:complete len:121 (-) Transcript_11702:204-566(-)